MTTKHSSVAGQIILRNRKKRLLNSKIRKVKAVISRATKSGYSEKEQIRAMLITQSTILDCMAELNRRMD